MVIAVVNKDHNQNEISLRELTVKLHLQAYRACCNGITGIAATVLSKAAAKAAPPLGKAFHASRKLIVVDFCWVSSLKVINATYAAFYKKQLFPKEDLKTSIQKKHEQEIEVLREKVGEKTVYPAFCKETALFINEFIPRFIGEKLTVLPSAVEGWVLFKLWYSVRYINYQVKKRQDYKTAFLQSNEGQWFKGLYDCLRISTAHFLTGHSSLESIINFEHLLLHLCIKISKPGNSKQNQSERVEAMVRSLANSLSQQKEIDRYLSQFTFSSDNETFIARLNWHKSKGSLPEGLPDPDDGLTNENLQQKLDESLTQYLNAKTVKFLDNLSLPHFNGGFLGLIYYLEGKDVLIQLISFLLSEYGIKQLSDPHLFALAILSSRGFETMGFEKNGFGLEKRKTILQVGQHIIQESLKNSDLNGINAIYRGSGLKQNPLGLEWIKQKEKVKIELKRCIASMLYQMIKPEDFQHPGGFLKSAREKASQFPIIGAATLSLHFLVSGTFFSLSYLFKSKDDTTSFPTWMFKHLSGKNLVEFVADKIVDLIYHPSWRITLLQMINTLIKSIENPTNQAPTEPSTLKQDLERITTFISEHFTEGTELSLKGNIGPLIDYLAGEKIYSIFLECIAPSENSPILENGIKSLVPTIKELLLYTRVIDSFRKDSLCFEGDAKFWECFLREWLNQNVAYRIKHKSKKPLNSSLSEIMAIRDQLVIELLSYNNIHDLRFALSRIPGTYFDLDYWELVPQDNEMKSFIWISPKDGYTNGLGINNEP